MNQRITTIAFSIGKEPTQSLEICLIKYFCWVLRFMLGMSLTKCLDAPAITGAMEICGNAHC